MRHAWIGLALGASLLGCGGDDKPTPKTPGSVTPGGVVLDKKGAEVAVIGAAPDETAKLNDAAKASYDKGFKAWLDGDLSTAKAAFRQASSEDPKSAAPEYSLGIVLEHLGEASAAQQAFRAAFSRQADYELAIGAYALSLAGKGAVSEADTFLTERHAKNPNSARISTYLGEVKSIAGDHASAQQLGQEALKNKPDLEEAMVLLARDHYRARKIDLARYALSAVLDGTPENPPRDKDNAEASLLRGIIEREYGRRSIALTALETASKRRPSLVEAHVQLGSMKLEAGNAAEALAPLEMAVKYGPQNAFAHLNLGDCYRLSGRGADAKRELDTAFSLDSSIAQVHYNRGLLYLFSPSIGGTPLVDQVGNAITEFEKFKAAKLKGVGEDVDELIQRAKAKQAELRAPTAAPPAATGSAPPATSASAAPTGAALPPPK
jgi:Tfp pilus assembly protein PilF